MREFFLAFLRDETATSAVEYGLFSALVAVVLAGTLRLGAHLTIGS